MTTDQPRPHLRPDGIPTRVDLRFATPAEKAIRDAIDEVERAGASVALTDAVCLLQKARDRVADHVEGLPDPPAVAPSAGPAQPPPSLPQRFAPGTVRIEPWRGIFPAGDAPSAALERWGNATEDEASRKFGWHQRPDGYWTPWHLAAAQLASARADAQRWQWARDHPETYAELLADWMRTADVNPTTGAWNDTLGLNESVDLARSAGAKTGEGNG